MKQYENPLDEIRDPNTSYARTLEILAEHRANTGCPVQPPQGSSFSENFKQGFLSVFYASEEEKQQFARSLGEWTCVLIILSLMMLAAIVLIPILV